MLLFCSEIKSDEFDDCAFVASNGKKYEYAIEVNSDMVRLSDCIGRSVPIDITNIDRVILALAEARNNMLVPLSSDVFINMES